MADSSTQRGIGRESRAEEGNRRGVTHLLVIGIDKYQHCPKLYNAVRDANAFKDILIKRFQFQEEHLITLFDQEATQSRIFDALSDLVEKVEEGDNVVIYFSGHGEYEKSIDEGYWVPVEGRLSQPGTYLSNSRIIKYLKAIRSHHTLLVVDSCFSGSLFLERKLGGVERLESLPSRWLITSGRNEVVSDGKPGDHSPFADALLQFLEHNQQDHIPITAIIDHVVESTVYNASQTPRGEPIPNVGHKGGQFYFHQQAAQAVSVHSLTRSPQVEDEVGNAERVIKGGAKQRKHLLLWGLPLLLVIASLWVYQFFKSPALTPLVENVSNHIVQGFHPFWMGKTYESYNFDFLDRISLYSYAINPHVGSFTNATELDELNAGDLVALAHQSDCQVLLSISNHGINANRVFLDNEFGQQEKLFELLLALLEKTDADGINVNFEFMPKNYGEKFTQFIVRLSESLNPARRDSTSSQGNTFLDFGSQTDSLDLKREESKEYLVEVSLSNKDQDIYQFKQLNAVVDQFIFSAYTLSEPNTLQIDGPLAPLETTDTIVSIASCIDFLVKQEIRKEKLILSIPFYGMVWGSSSKEPFTESKFIEYNTFSGLQRRFGEAKSLAFQYSEMTQNAFIVYDASDVLLKTGDTKYRYLKVWSDDTYTLNNKYRWAIEQGLGGISIWALGYDQGLEVSNALLREKESILSSN